MAAPVFSVVLCTRNRAKLLADALESLLAVDFRPQDFELCLVDNDSSDDTALVVERFAKRAPFEVRYLLEKKIGLSAARNRAIREARGRYLFFTDDDQLVDPAILREHLRVAQAHGARAIQGAIALEFPAGRPSWLRGPLTTVFGQTQDVPEGPANIHLYGGNMVFEKSLFDGFTAFREDLGKGAVGYSEDIEITRRLRARGETIVYAPTARIYHVIGPDRASASFLRRNSFEKGYSDGHIKKGVRAWLVTRSLFKAAAQGAWALVSLPSRHHSILAQTRAFDHLGRALGVMKASHGSRPT
jgi:glycosyltransferase involved in cell wall biosynthesis